MKIVLANRDYITHTSDEGQQLQFGLQHAGWTLCGTGYGDDCHDVAALLDRHLPEAVFVQDMRDMDPANDGCYDKTVGFHNLSALRDYPGFVVAPLKDAGSMHDYQRRFLDDIGADACVIYYHPQSVLAAGDWAGRRFIRTWHSADAELIGEIPMAADRKRGIVTGAIGKRVYPVRSKVFRHADRVGIDTLKHPGYGNAGRHTPDYLRTLAGYKVHVATASKYGFALRKIIESVAVGCTPVTDLPEYDVLPEIDGALLRIRPGAALWEVTDAVNRAERQWDLDERMAWAEKARKWYDWRAMGTRLSNAIHEYPADQTSPVRPRSRCADPVSADRA